MSNDAFESMTPILRVEDMQAAIDYYTRILGFHLEWNDATFGSIRRGRCHIFLAAGDQGHPGSWMYIGVEDCDAVHAEFVSRGARIRHAPTNYDWAYEMQVEDLDGNVLRIGSEPKEGEARGEWLDMNGVRWRMDGEGRWTRVR